MWSLRVLPVSPWVLRGLRPQSKQMQAPPTHPHDPDGWTDDGWTDDGWLFLAFKIVVYTFSLI